MGYVYLFICKYMNETYVILGKVFLHFMLLWKVLTNIFLKLNLDFLLYLIDFNNWKWNNVMERYIMICFVKFLKYIYTK